MDYELLVLLALTARNNSKVIDKTLIHQKLYLLSRKLNKNFGYKSLVYNIYSQEVESAIISLYNKRFIDLGFILNPFRSFLVVMQDGKDYLTKNGNTIEYLHYEMLLNKLSSHIFDSKVYTSMLIAIDQIAQKVGGLENTKLIINCLRIQGWYPRLPEFLRYYNTLKSIRLHYTEKPMILK
jgi:hypothetical protein